MNNPQNKISTFLLKLERKTNLGFVACIVGLFFLGLSMLFCTPSFEPMYHGKVYSELANNPFDWDANYSLQYRILDLNLFKLTLADTALLINESEASRITGLAGGEVVITLSLNAPAGINAGNLGAVITSASNLGNVVIKRGHKEQSGTGLSGSVHRYFDITPDNNAALDATFRYYYFDAEMNSQTENNLAMFKSVDDGVNWSSQNFGNRNTTENFVENAGINSFSRWTLSSASGALPVIGLEFDAKRINNNQVQLNWKTQQEFNNLGFSIERKKENENNFISRGFVNSLATGGNS